MNSPADKGMTAEGLLAALRPLQEKKGYHFNADPDMTMPLMEQLLVTRKRYGHMACPCRFATGNYEDDKDIICPCVYRDPDLAEYGSCFCGLYVTEEWNKGTIPHRDVPERRPPEKVKAALEHLQSAPNNIPIS